MIISSKFAEILKMIAIGCLCVSFSQGVLFAAKDVLVRPVSIVVINPVTKKGIQDIRIIYQLTTYRPGRIMGIPTIEPVKTVVEGRMLTTDANGKVDIPGRMIEMGRKEWFCAEYILVNIELKDDETSTNMKARNEPASRWKSFRCRNRMYSGVFAITSDGVIERGADTNAVYVDGGYYREMYFDRSLAKQSECLVFELEGQP